MAWFAGVGLLWLSGAWSTREKSLATLIGPVGAGLSLALLNASDSDALGLVAIAIFALASLAFPVYLGTKLRRRGRGLDARDLAGAR